MYDWLLPRVGEDCVAQIFSQTQAPTERVQSESRGGIIQCE